MSSSLRGAFGRRLARVIGLPRTGLPLEAGDPACRACRARHLNSVRNLSTVRSSPHPTARSEALWKEPRSPLRLADFQARRSFRSTPQRQDVFFLAFPALKGALLNLTRASILTLPFIWRWRLWRKYRRTSMILVNIPIIAICLVFALGLDQAPRTARWRLLLMSEGEEMAWSGRKHDEVLLHDGPLILPSTDSRVSLVTRISTRLITALESQTQQVVHGASWPPREPRPGGHALTDVMAEREARIKRGGMSYEPSGVAKSDWVVWRPGSSNPLKKLETDDWKLWVVDLPTINAFALPSKDIFVYAGLIDMVEDETLLSAVMAHEIAHVAQRHAVENVGFLNMAAVAFDILRGISFALTISFPFITDSAGLAINWLNDVVAQRAYSRKLEMEADEVGLELMAAAGYDPRSAIDLWDLMAAVEADAASKGTPVSIVDKFSLLQTHPTSHIRQEAIARLMPKAMETYKASPYRIAELQQALASKRDSQPLVITDDPRISKRGQPVDSAADERERAREKAALEQAKSRGHEVVAKLAVDQGRVI